MKRSEFNIGEFLTVKETGRTFIHDGYVNGDGYGVVIGETADGEILKSSGYGNFCIGAEVMLASSGEKNRLIIEILGQEYLNNY